MSEEKQNTLVGRFWTSKDTDGTTKGYSGSINKEALSQFPTDDYGNVKVWFFKNKNKRSDKKDCDFFVSAFVDTKGGGRAAPAKAAYKKPYSAPKAKPAAAPAAEDDGDFLD